MNHSIQSALQIATRETLAELTPDGHWVGELSTSALSTATAAFALSRVRSEIATGRAEAFIADAELERLILGGLRWLAANRNHDGGWGDTIRSHSNISTTTLCWAALNAPEARANEFTRAIADAESWILREAGSLVPTTLAKTIADRYGKDRTFSVPILTMCAIAGRLGDPRTAWKLITPLPFEAAAIPHRWLKFLQLPVVSYALPALIAIGQVIHHHRPSVILPIRWLRESLVQPTLDVLERIQPGSGGFLEAAPLTSFVTMSLAACGRADHPVVRNAVRFLRETVRADGSWPIDTNLATWTTTLAINALAESGPLDASLTPDQISKLRAWLIGQQYREVHPFTNAEPGGWAWTDLTGGVPDADDTPGALIAIRKLGPLDAEIRSAGAAGVRWLLDLQNRDGGMPTFCRGWGALPFDRSGADLSAHALRAFIAWRNDLPDAVSKRLPDAATDMLDYLRRHQRASGAWLPLWFGNQNAHGFKNPVYGTSRVLIALNDLASSEWKIRGTMWLAPMRDRARAYLLRTQNTDGSWGGAPGVAGSMEETSLALDALSGYAHANNTEPLRRGGDWLAARITKGDLTTAAPIGFYFANLWYYERMYPKVFALAALGKLAASPRN